MLGTPWHQVSLNTVNVREPLEQAPPLVPQQPDAWLHILYSVAETDDANMAHAAMRMSAPIVGARARPMAVLR